MLKACPDQILLHVHVLQRYFCGISLYKIFYQHRLCLKGLTIALNRETMLSVQFLALVLSLWRFVTVCDNQSSLWRTGNNRVFTSGYYRLVTNLPTLCQDLLGHRLAVFPSVCMYYVDEVCIRRISLLEVFLLCGSCNDKISWVTTCIEPQIYSLTLLVFTDTGYRIIVRTLFSLV